MARAGPPAGSRALALVVGLAVAVVLLGAIPRVLLAMNALPSWARPFVWSDVLFVWIRGARGGLVPYRDVYFEYPPIIAGLWGAVASVAGSLPVDVALWAIIQALCAGIVAWVLVRAVGPARTLLFWSLSPQLLLYGSLNFETLALAPLAIAVVMARRGATTASALATAIGAATKLFPAAILPAVLSPPYRAGHRGSAALAAIAFTAVVAAAFVPGALSPYSSLQSLYRYSVGIAPNSDSVWGLTLSIFRAAGVDASPWILFGTIAGLAVTFFLVVLPATWRARDVAAASGLAIATVMIWSRLYSPQYSLWILPFFALADLPRRIFVLLTLADVGVFFAIYPLSLVPWTPGDGVQSALLVGLTAAVVLRHGALILTWLALRSRCLRAA